MIVAGDDNGRHSGSVSKWKLEIEKLRSYQLSLITEVNNMPRMRYTPTSICPSVLLRLYFPRHLVDTLVLGLRSAECQGFHPPKSWFALLGRPNEPARSHITLQFHHYRREHSLRQMSNKIRADFD